MEVRRAAQGVRRKERGREKLGGGEENGVFALMTSEVSIKKVRLSSTSETCDMSD
jgi:hypothetical protein